MIPQRQNPYKAFMLQLPTSSFFKYHHTHKSQNGCDAGEPKNCTQMHELEKGK